MIALYDTYRTGLLKSTPWLSNLTAGLIVGVVALPLGIKPEQGLHTAIIAGLMVGIFGSSRVQIAGPTGAFVALLASITARYGVDGLQMTTLLADTSHRFGCCCECKGDFSDPPFYAPNEPIGNHYP